MNAPVVQRRPNGQLMPGAAVLNPNGRPCGNGIEALREKYIGRLDEFFAVLIDLTRSKNENMRLRAAAELLDRLIGRPQVTIDAVTTKVDIGAMYLQALQRANSGPIANSHIVPGETVIDDDNSNAGAASKIQ
jgi:hypothetical protein